MQFIRRPSLQPSFRPPRILHRGWFAVAVTFGAFFFAFAPGKDGVQGEDTVRGENGTPGENAALQSLEPPGWLGLAIDDSLVPGRLVVVEVDDGGPASKAGIRLQDMVLAIDGEPTLDADRFAAAIATIGPAEKVRFSIARGGTVEELTLVATEAPAEAARLDRSPAPIADGLTPTTESAFGRPPSDLPASAAPPSSSPTGASAVAGAPVAVVPPFPSSPTFSDPRPAGSPPTDPRPAGSPDPWQGSTGSDPAAASDRAAAFERPPERPLERPPAVDGSAAFVRDAGRGKTALGVRTIPVDPVVQARYSLSEPTGALVVGLVDDLPASRAGLPTGSVIVAFDRQPVRSPTELTKLVSEGPTDRPVKLEYILPGGESRAAEVSLVSVPSVAVPTQLEPTPSARANGLGVEIRELRRTIESLTKRLDELERRSIDSR